MISIEHPAVKIIIILLLWYFHILRRKAFFLYFWQLKEYRLDRFLEEIRRRRGLIFSKFFFLAVIALAMWLFLPIQESFKEWIILALYFLFALYSLRLLLKQKWALPKFTQKMATLFVFVLVMEGLLIWRFISDSVLFILVFEALLPLFIFLNLEIIQIPKFFLKKRIIVMAKKKISDNPDRMTIGITGSYGKSSVKEILYSLIAEGRKVLKTSEHINTEMGVARTVLSEINNSHRHFICEMAAYRQGEINAICRITKPRIGIITGINAQHLALFGSQEKIIQAKYELIESLPDDGVAIFNGDNKYCLELYKKTNKPKRIYGLNRDREGMVPDVWADEIKIGNEFTLFKIIFKTGETIDCKTSLLGRHNVLNILGAVCVARELGVGISELSKACAGLFQKGGMKVQKGINGLNIIDSSYSANPDGVMADLDYLKNWTSQKVIVMPSLIELGAEAKKVHQEIGRRISQICDLAIITTEDNFQDIVEGAGGKNVLLIKNPREIVQKITEFCQPDDVVLLEGRAPKGTIEGLLAPD
ncbi:UDP-N-acetylmuramoyl-tripeptide--D-alanyl-D-alanine ligase [Patescibacteria group bacterium]|nr:UDP-N-acetylmuramoyl-tripeptide--D-alanyl-D-alanine ligase [Patescibacteria group bacterium]